MKDKLLKTICKHGAQLRALAMFIAPLVSRACWWKYYQPVELKGIADFARANRNRDNMC